MIRNSYRTLCLASVAATAIAQPSAAQTAIAQPSAAQTAAPPAETIVVTGLRAAQFKSVSAKLATDLIQDTVSQDDIGRLPDTTVAEAIRRIPGVSVDLLTDNARGREEVQRAAIRGFDAKFNLVTVDGVKVAQIDSGALATGTLTRAFNLNLLPTSLVSQLVVRKSASADYDPQSLGGEVDIVTRSALSGKNATGLDLTALGGLDSSAGASTSARHPSEHIDGTFRTRVDIGGARLGLLISGNYKNWWAGSNGTTIGVPGASGQNAVGWTYYGANGRSVADPSLATYPAVPTRYQAYSFDDQITQASGSAKIELETDGGLHSSLFGGVFTQLSKESRNEALITRTSSQIAGTGAVGTGVAQNIAPTGGLVAIADGELGLTYQPIRATTSFINWATSAHIAPKLDAHLDIAYSSALGRLDRDMAKWDAATSTSASGSVSGASIAALGYTYDSSALVPTLAFNTPGAFTNSGAYLLTYLRQITYREMNKVFEVNPNLKWNAGPDDRGIGLRLGGQYTRNSINYSPNYVEYDGKSAYSYPMSTVLYQNGLTIPAFGNVVFPLINRSAVDALRTQILANAPSSVTAIDETSVNYGSRFALTEDTLAGFATGTYRTDDLTVEAGVRYDRTHIAINSLSQVSNGVYAPVASTSVYGKWLPSVLAVYRAGPNLVLRGAFSETLGRPDYSAYGPLAKVGQPSNGTIAVTLGNPAIQPRMTRNYDAAVDVFFDRRRSLVSLQYFHKDLTNETYNQLYTSPYVYNGVTYTGNFTKPVSGASAQVDGIEANLSKDHLPLFPQSWGNLGAALNYTLIGTRFHIYDAALVPRTLENLVGQPKNILNATLFYSFKSFDATVTFNRQGTTLFQTGYAAWADTYVLPRNQLDFSAHYRLTGQVTLTAQASNITREPFVSTVGPNRNLLADYYTIGTTYWAGASFKF